MYWIVFQTMGKKICLYLQMATCRADIAQGKSIRETKNISSDTDKIVLKLPSVSFMWVLKTFAFFVGTFLIGFGTGFGVGYISVVNSPSPPAISPPFSPQSPPATVTVTDLPLPDPSPSPSPLPDPSPSPSPSPM